MRSRLAWPGSFSRSVGASGWGTGTGPGCRTGAGRGGPPPFRNAGLRSRLLLDGQDQLEGRRPAGLDLEATDRAADGVAVGVEARGSKHGRQVLGRHDVLEDFIAIVGASLLERRQGDVRGGVAVGGVDGRVLARVVGLVFVVPVLARTG